MMGSIALTPDKDSRAEFAADAGTAGLSAASAALPTTW